MGFGKERNRIREQLPKWHCEGFFGYGHGRAIEEFGEEPLKDKSVCIDICPKTESCRLEHHARMDLRFPEVAKVVQAAAKASVAMQRPIVKTVVAAMQVAESRKIPGTEEIRGILSFFKIADNTDHYIAGQLENIQNGIDKKSPDNVRQYNIQEVGTSQEKVQ